LTRRNKSILSPPFSFKKWLMEKGMEKIRRSSLRRSESWVEYTHTFLWYLCLKLARSFDVSDDFFFMLNICFLFILQKNEKSKRTQSRSTLRAMWGYHENFCNGYVSNSYDILLETLKDIINYYVEYFYSFFLSNYFIHTYNLMH